MLKMQSLKFRNILVKVSRTQLEQTLTRSLRLKKLARYEMIMASLIGVDKSGNKRLQSLLIYSFIGKCIHTFLQTRNNARVNHQAYMCLMFLGPCQKVTTFIDVL
jgi:hypothetical protein